MGFEQRFNWENIWVNSVHIKIISQRQENAIGFVAKEKEPVSFKL
jgi:hypothetical protein